MSCFIVVYIPAVTFVESGVSKLWLLVLKPVFLYCALTFVKCSLNKLQQYGINVKT
jgi:hypothetical protein